ncbi:NIL domain-containing protein [Dehalococcoidia bacterium]|nr:NIL domain-containing protein [Dehalococcoidia bacterium]
MTKRRARFTFPTGLITEPVIFNLGRDFDVVTNIRRADVREDVGWVVLEIEGDEDEIDKGLAWVKSMGVRVDPVTGDVVDSI